MKATVLKRDSKGNSSSFIINGTDEDDIKGQVMELNGWSLSCGYETEFTILNVLPAGVSLVVVNAKWECCKCGWIGKHSESADKTPVVSNAWLLVCPKCGNKDGFHACR